MKTGFNYYKLFVIYLMAVIFHGCSSGGDENTGAVAETTSAEPVKVIKLDFTRISRNITYPANLKAYREVHLAPASPGRVERIYIDAGSRVVEGQLIVEMDRTQFQQAKLQLESLERDYRRMDTLKRAGSVSQQQFDQISMQYELALSNVRFLEDNTRLLAPFSGTVSGKYYENGEMFSGAPNTPSGKAALLSIVQTTRLKATANLSENYLPYVKPGMPVRLTTDVWPGEDFTGTITMIYPSVNPVTRSFTIEFGLSNEDGKLRPGMFARARLDIDHVEVLAVPALAVMKLQGSNERFIFLEEDGIARRVSVRLGDRFDDMVELISDEISAGDNVIIAGQARLLDGVAVRVD